MRPVFVSWIMGLNISKMWFWIDTLGSNLKETLIFNWNVIQFGALWAGNLLRHILMIVELSVIPTNDSLIIRLNYLNPSFSIIHAISFFYCCVLNCCSNLYIPSTINIWKKVLTKAIWADKKWAGFWQISLYIK